LSKLRFRKLRGVPLLALLLLLACGPAATSVPVNPTAIPADPNPVLDEPTTVSPAATQDLDSLASSSNDPCESPPTPTRTPRPTSVPARVEELAILRYQIQGWETDFTKRSVSLRKIFSGGPTRDVISPLDDPSFVSVSDADSWLGPKEPVILFELEGEAREYPLQLLIWHEIVNYEVGGVPVSVTFCPLCNAAITLGRRLDGVVYDFGTSGNLPNSDLVMWDGQTESWWQQFTD